MIALGGGLGGLARYGLEVASSSRVPWGTLAANVLGCALIGVLLVLVTEVWSAHRLLRPFVGVGLLGGFTTFSTYAVEVRELLAAGLAGLGLAYLVGTLLGCLAATVTGVALARRATRARRLR